jgi:hypothetical protein
MPEASMSFERPLEQTKLRRATIEMERTIHKRVEDLVLCGVRPKVIYQVIERKISIPEVKRIHNFLSPVAASERHGRNVKPATADSLPPETQAVYIECFALVSKAIEGGAMRADALAAAWRIIAGRYGFSAHSQFRGCRCEEMIVLFLNVEVGELCIKDCNFCSSTSISSSAWHCASCAIGVKRNRKFA